MSELIPRYEEPIPELNANFRAVADGERESINDDIVFEIELIKQVEVNVDYILLLVEQYLKAKGTGKDREIRATIDRAVASSPSLRNKKDLIEQFVDSVSITEKVDAAWVAFITARRSQELDRIIAEEGLDAISTRAFMENAFRDGAVRSSGTAITKILPPVSRFSPGAAHAAKKQTVLDRLSAFFERFSGLAEHDSSGST